jgi:hypothetical protein
MSVCKTDALAAWRSEQNWCTREDLDLHAARSAASEAVASAISPRVQYGAATADRTPVSALPKRPAIGRLRHLCWCWLEDSNLPPLAYEASALPDELSQLCKLTKGSRRRPRSGSDLVMRRGSAPRPNLDVHHVKERGATGAVGIGVWTHGTRARAHAHTLSQHELGLHGLRLVLWAICPPALAAEGKPCAGYSGFSLELCSDRLSEREKPQ